MMLRRLFMTVLCAGAIFSAALPVRADDIDEKQAILQEKVNQAAASKKLSNKDASELRKELSKFDEKKRQTRTAHKDVLSVKDDKELDTSLSDINQHFEEKVKAKASTEK